jgi:hypothetical protein
VALQGFRGSSTGAFIARHKALLFAFLVLGVAGAIFIIAYFEPQKLLIDERVDEAAPLTARGKENRTPVTGRATVQPGQTAPGQAAAPAVLAQGGFRSLEHQTTGEAVVSQLPDGSRVLRLESFETSNGPDLRVYLSAGSNDAAFGREYGMDFVELGQLKGNIGSQNYSVPAGVDLGRYRNAVIWCKRFGVGFGVATLEVAA